MKMTLKITASLVLAIAAPLAVLKAGCFPFWPTCNQATPVETFVAPSTSDSELSITGTGIQLAIAPSKKHAQFLRTQRHRQRAYKKAQRLSQTSYDNSSDEEGDYLQKRINQRRNRRKKVAKIRRKRAKKHTRTLV